MSDPRPPAARTGPGDARLESILVTAERMFFERGYRAVSIRDLAAEVGIKMSSLYHYFPSKDDILYQIVKRHLDGLLEATDRFSLGMADGAPAMETLRALIERSVSHLLTHHMAAEVAASQSRELEGTKLREIGAGVAAFEARFLEIIRAGAATGEFAVPDAQLASFAVLGAIARTTVWYRPAGRLSITQIAAAYSELLVRGLVAIPG